MGEEDCVPILSPWLEQLNSIVLLRRAVRTVFIIASVTGVDLPAEDGAFKGAAGLPNFFAQSTPKGSRSHPAA